MNSELKIIDDFTEMVHRMASIIEGMKELQNNPNATITQVPTGDNPPPTKEEEEAAAERFKKLLEGFNKHY